MGATGEQWDFDDRDPDWRRVGTYLRGLDLAEQPERVYAPFPEPDGHEHHNRIGLFAAEIWPAAVRFYTTYSRTSRPDEIDRTGRADAVGDRREAARAGALQLPDREPSLPAVVRRRPLRVSGCSVKVGLYLTNEKGLAVLNAALASGVEIAHVTYAPAKGMNDDSDKAIALIAKQSRIPTFLHAHPPEFTGDYSIAAGWRRMLDVPNLIVLHDSLLPRYRGFAPLITALVNGEPFVGVTAFLAEAEPDTGPIVGRREMPVIYPARMRQVLDRLVPLYAQLATEVLEQLPDLSYAVQDHERATWSVWRDEDDYRIDWTRDDRRILRLIDAVSDPFPGAWTTDGDGNMLRIHRAAIVPDRTARGSRRRQNRLYRRERFPGHRLRDGPAANRGGAAAPDEARVNALMICPWFGPLPVWWDRYVDRLALDRLRVPVRP